jgi:3-mercaptopyruvate sulfurtransferase SseA
MPNTPKRPPPADQSATFSVPARSRSPFVGPDTKPRPKAPPRPGRAPVAKPVPAEDTANWDDLMKRRSRDDD